jgi:gliding motility-associated-like protein
MCFLWIFENRNMKLIKQLIGILLFAVISKMAVTQDLTEITNNLPEGANSLILTADIDIDGLPDVFIAGETISSEFIGLYKNTGDSSFFDLGVSIPYLFDATACFSDLNNDGYADLLYAGLDASFNYQFYIYINQQNNTFISLPNSIPGIRYGDIQCRDMDHDGWQDIFIVGYSTDGNISRLFKNNADLTFSLVDFSFEGLRYGGIIIADFDQNSYPDIIYTGLHSSLSIETYYYQNVGEMQFTNVTNGLPAAQLGNIEACDVDNDGFMDVALFGKDDSNNHITKIFKNNNGLSFTFLCDLEGMRKGALKAADFNNDGYSDIILTGSNSGDTYRTLLYTNNAGAGFTPETDTVTGLGYSDALWFDFNLDNKNDLLICGTSLSESKSMLLASNIATANQNPLVISGLTSVVNSDTVVLSWDKGTDIETNEDGLTYDLYLETNTATAIKFLPFADLASGKRHTLNYGALSVRNLQLNGIPEGKYWWSVQSVDAAFAGSPFAIADTFYISRPIDLGNDTALCYGDTISLSLSDVDGSVEWYHLTNPTIPIGTGKEIKVEIINQETIWAVVTKDYGDKISDTIAVNMNPLPIVDLGDDFAVCYGDDVNLSLCTDSDTIDWFTDSGIFQDNNSGTFVHNFFADDKIYAELTDINSCSNSDSLLLTVRPLPIIELVNDTALCNEDNLILNIGSANDSINWYSLTNPQQILNSNEFVFNVTYNDTFQVEYFDQFRCVNYDTLNVFARAHPNADAGEDKLICATYDVEIGPETIVDSWSYMWNSDGDISDVSNTNPLVHPSVETKYNLTVTDQYGCIGYDSTVVKINPVGTLDAGVDKAVCIGDSILIGGEPTAEGSIFPYNYQWSPVYSLDDATSPNPVAAPEETTIYSLIVFTGDCPVDTLNAKVTVNPLPIIDIINDTVTGFKEDMPLWATGGVEYTWTPADGLDNPYTSDPIANIDQTTRFIVNVIDENNCEDTSGVVISVLNEIFIPDLFTPNNDLCNDMFKVYGVGINEIELVIYNSEGLEVYYSKNPEEIMETGWDGKINDYDAKEGKYFWKISGTFFNGNELKFKGKKSGVVTLLR